MISRDKAFRFFQLYSQIQELRPFVAPIHVCFEGMVIHGMHFHQCTSIIFLFQQLMYFFGKLAKMWVSGRPESDHTIMIWLFLGCFSYPFPKFWSAWRGFSLTIGGRYDNQMLHPFEAVIMVHQGQMAFLVGQKQLAMQFLGILAVILWKFVLDLVHGSFEVDYKTRNH